MMDFCLVNARSGKATCPVYFREGTCEHVVAARNLENLCGICHSLQLMGSTSPGPKKKKKTDADQGKSSLPSIVPGHGLTMKFRGGKKSALLGVSVVLPVAHSDDFMTGKVVNLFLGGHDFAEGEEGGEEVMCAVLFPTSNGEGHLELFQLSEVEKALESCRITASAKKVGHGKKKSPSADGKGKGMTTGSSEGDDEIIDSCESSPPWSTEEARAVICEMGLTGDDLITMLSYFHETPTDGSAAYFFTISQLPASSDECRLLVEKLLECCNDATSSSHLFSLASRARSGLDPTSRLAQPIQAPTQWPKHGGRCKLGGLIDLAVAVSMDVSRRHPRLVAGMSPTYFVGVLRNQLGSYVAGIATSRPPLSTALQDPYYPSTIKYRSRRIYGSIGEAARAFDATNSGAANLVTSILGDRFNPLQDTGLIETPERDMPELTYGIGLRNPQNRCYINAVLQALSQISPLNDAILTFGPRLACYSQSDAYDDESVQNCVLMVQ